MKCKIISLIICVACLISVLASCSNGKVEVCETCVDADRNAACDVCGTTVVTVVEKVPTEEQAVDMVVSAIPNTATLGDVIALTVSENAIPTTVEICEEKLGNRKYGLVYFIKYTEKIEAPEAEVSEAEAE